MSEECPMYFCFENEKLKVTLFDCSAGLDEQHVFRVDSGCVYAAPGLYPSGRVCCLTAVLTVSAAAALGSSPTCSPTVHSLAPSHIHNNISSATYRIY